MVLVFQQNFFSGGAPKLNGYGVLGTKSWLYYNIVWGFTIL
jgi:hypothetical protein